MPCLPGLGQARRSGAAEHCHYLDRLGYALLTLVEREPRAIFAYTPALRPTFTVLASEEYHALDCHDALKVLELLRAMTLSGSHNDRPIMNKYSYRCRHWAYRRRTYSHGTIASDIWSELWHRSTHPPFQQARFGFRCVAQYRVLSFWPAVRRCIAAL